MTLTLETVAAHEARRRDALVAIDKAALGDLLADDLIWTHATGATDSKASYLAALGTRAQFVAITPETEDIALYGDAAAIKSDLTMVIKPHGQPAITLKTFALAVWARDPEGALRLTRFQSGTVPG